MERVGSEEWAKRVERWKDSGLSAKEFAVEVGLNEHSLRWWRWHLGTTQKSQPGKPRTRRPRSAVTSAPKSPALTFVEMVATPREPMEIILASGIRVRVGADFDATTLGRLLDVLGR
jgi:hypothetical protein